MDLKEKNIAEIIAKVIEEGKTTNIVLIVELIWEFGNTFTFGTPALPQEDKVAMKSLFCAVFLSYYYYFNLECTLAICSASDTDDSRELFMAGRSHLSIQEFASAIPNHLLLGSLLEHLCFVYESNPARSRMLFKGTQSETLIKSDLKLYVHSPRS